MLQPRVSSTRLALVLALAIALLGLASPIVAARVPPQGPPTPAAAPAATPTTIWSITWTTTKSMGGQTDNSSYSYVMRYDYANSASLLYRVYPDGSDDNANFKLHVAADYDDTTTWKCTDNWNHIIGYAPEHEHYTTADPERYNDNPAGRWQFQPYEDPAQGWVGSLNYTWNPGYIYAGTERRNGSDCSGQVWDTTTGWQAEEWSSICVQLPRLQGNAQGSEFTYHATGTDKYGGCDGLLSWLYNNDEPDHVQWSIDIKVQLLKAHDLTVDRLEVTQGLQDDANSLPLVQGRRTVVRVFLGLGTDAGPVPSVTGALEGYAGATKLGTVYPFNPQGSISAPGTPDWKKIDDTLNFQLPEAWTRQPALQLKVKVNPYHTVTESDYTNNERSADVNLRACNGLSIAYLPVHYAPPGGFTPADPSANITAGQVFMQKVYPLSDTGLTYVPRGAYTLLQDINSDDVSGTFRTSLIDLLAISTPPHADHIFAWLPPLAYAGNGRGQIPGVPAFGNDTETPDRWRRTFAHEVGHNFGLLHPDPDLTTEGDHWFDVYDRVIKPVPAGVGGSDLLDFMVPERLEPEAWIGPQNYKYLVDKLCSPASAASAAGGASAGFQAPRSANNLLITGLVGHTTPAVGSLSPLFWLTNVPTSTLPMGSQYCLNLRDAAGNRLSTYCFNGNFADDSVTPDTAGPFSLVVAAPAALHSVELTEAATGSVLSTRTASAHRPTVSVDYPNAAGLVLAGAQVVAWTAADQDGDPLTYDVLYSPDNGATWQGLAADLSTLGASVDFSKLPGTPGASGMIKVLVSDGFYTAEDTSNNPFTVANKAPSAAILTPSSGASFSTSNAVTLDGRGVDLQDGSLPDAALRWASSVDGALGTGRVLDANLSAGQHTITLTATDSQGLHGTASIQVSVAQGRQSHVTYLPLLRK